MTAITPAGLIPARSGTFRAASNPVLSRSRDLGPHGQPRTELFVGQGADRSAIVLIDLEMQVSAVARPRSVEARMSDNADLPPGLDRRRGLHQHFFEMTVAIKAI